MINYNGLRVTAINVKKNPFFLMAVILFVVSGEIEQTLTIFKSSTITSNLF